MHSINRAPQHGVAITNKFTVLETCSSRITISTTDVNSWKIYNKNVFLGSQIIFQVKLESRSQNCHTTGENTAAFHDQQ